VRIQTAATILTFVNLGCLVSQVRAGTIDGSFDGNATLTPTGTPGIYSQSFTGDGTDSRFGAFTVHSTSTVDFSDPPSIAISNGQLVQTFGQGKLFGTGSGDGTASGHGTATFSVDFVVTGGTGLFMGATGDVVVTGTITSTGPTTETVNASYKGSLTLVPEPGSFAIFGPVIIVFASASMRRWRRPARVDALRG
jgi:hypothetical protein